MCRRSVSFLSVFSLLSSGVQFVVYRRSVSCLSVFSLLFIGVQLVVCRCSLCCLSAFRARIYVSAPQYVWCYLDNYLVFLSVSILQYIAIHFHLFIGSQLVC